MYNMFQQRFMDISFAANGNGDLDAEVNPGGK